MQIPAVNRRAFEKFAALALADPAGPATLTQKIPMGGGMRILLTVLFLLGSPVFADCKGQNLLTRMDPADVARLQAAAATQPFHQGNLWQATKDDATITMVGTYHLPDPRHDAMLARVQPLLDSAKTVLVEAGPEEEAAIKAQAARDPSLFIMPDTTLPTLMAPTEWQALSDAMSRRGVPGFMAAKFQPWYVSVLLAVPPCMMASMEKPDGLDHRITAAAQTRGLPVKALEPHDTVFKLFETFPRADQVSMLRSSLAIEPSAEDYIATLADTYFAGESRLIWELMRDLSLKLPGYTPEQVDADLARMEQALVVTRNAAWIPVLESAAEQGPVLAAFGALHLPGKHGIPYLLQERGWTITPLAD